MGRERYSYEALYRAADALWLLLERLDHKSLQGPAHRFRDELDRLAKPLAWGLPHMHRVLECVLLERVEHPRSALCQLFRDRLKQRAPT